MSRTSSAATPRALVIASMLVAGAWTTASAQQTHAGHDTPAQPATCCGGQAGTSGGAGGGGCCGNMHGAMKPQAGGMDDMQLFHQLFDSRTRITRTVTVRPDGIETVTESDDPAVAKLIQAHVASMAARVKEARPIHQRDPLFREVFKHTDQIAMQHELTATGVRVVETSADPYVVKLIQAHAEVVSAFIANGHAEMMKNHPVPPRGE
jgi:hypothetical protein